MNVTTSTSNQGPVNAKIEGEEWRGYDQDGYGLVVPTKRTWVAGDEFHGLMRYSGSEGRRYWHIVYHDQHSQFFATIFFAKSDRHALAEIGLKKTLTYTRGKIDGPEWLIETHSSSEVCAIPVECLSQGRIDFLYDVGLAQFSEDS